MSRIKSHFMLTPEGILITTVEDPAEQHQTKRIKYRKHTQIRIHSQADDYYKKLNTDKTSIALNILTPEQSVSRFTKYRETVFSLTPVDRMEQNLFWRTLSLTSRIHDENRLIREKLKEYDQYNRAK